MKKNLESKKGITLVALVVTIIILLILAGITISTLTQNGLFEKVKEAKQKYEISEIKEKIEMEIMTLRIEKGKEESLTKEDLLKINSAEITVKSVENFPVEVISNGYKFKVDENFVVTFVGEYEDNTQTSDITTRYLLVEVNGHLENEDCAVINEIAIYNKYNEKINYTILNDLEYDSSTNGKSEYWEDMRYWNYTNLNDGEYIYTSNYPSGNQNCTLFFSGTNSWARFIIDLGEEQKIGQILLYIGGYDELSPCKSRTPKEVSFYTVNNFINGIGENTTYDKNIKQKNNDGLTLIKEKEFSETLLTTTMLELLDDNSQNYIKARYLLVEVNGHLENEDCAVINEIAIYDKYNEKINYTILNDLEYDSSTNGKSEYWEDMRYWNYTNLNDGEYIYTSNYPSGNQNCTLFSHGTNSWARFIIDLGEEQKIGQILLYIGGYDELSPCKSRIPREVSFYSVNNFITGTEENTTYDKNIKQKNNDGLTFISNKIFEEILTTPTEIKLLNKY